jgi:hypothetical protein
VILELRHHDAGEGGVTGTVNNLGNLSVILGLGGECLRGSPVSNPNTGRMQNVLGLSMTGMLMASAVVAVLVLALALLANRKPKRAEKWEKAEIMKQLLALSEREESMQRMKQAMKTRTPSSQPMMRQASTANSKPVSRPAPAGKSGVRANVAAAGKAR